MMRARDAKLLRRLGQGTYETRVMVPAAPVIDLDSMDRDALHALAKERGIKVHHMAGADKVREALREAKE